MSTRLTQPRRRSTAESTESIPLRLTATKGGIGIELSRPQTLGPLRVTELQWSLPGLSFPLDLSGGVREFRHRRGVLQHVVLEVELTALAAWFATRLRDCLGGLTSAVSLWGVEGGLGVGVVGAAGAAAFELLWVPTAEVGRCVVSRPRTAGDLPGPAIATVLPLVDSIVTKLGKRRGRTVDFGAVVGELVRGLLPALGVRVPSVSAMWLSALDFDGDVLTLRADVGEPSSPWPPSSVAALELANLASGADESLVAGRVDEARAGYMTALEKAPRHPELCHVIAAIDKDYAERCEAALGLLVEALAATDFGCVGAELLAQTGDVEGAMLAIEKQARTEPYPPLAALLWLRASQLVGDSTQQLRALDQALAVCPSSLPTRWARFHARVQLGDLNGAVADAEHVEAACVGAASKHQAILTAAREMRAVGFVQPARRLFERALRYVPKDVEATLGLARCFAAEGNARRALLLLQRCAELVDEQSELYGVAQLELAEQLANGSRDLPQAIARARRVAGAGETTARARALEGRWRDQLGDFAGAAMAFARLRDTVAVMPQASPACTPLLLEAARFFELRDDPRAAERHLSLALALAPGNSEVLDRFRSVSGKLSAVGVPSLQSPPQVSLSPDSAQPPRSTGGVLQNVDPDSDPDWAIEAESEADRLQTLMSSGQALDDDQLTRLCTLLQQLERLDELYALLSARHEEADPAEREQLVPSLVSTLEGLERRARERGDDDEAELYASARQRFGAA